MPFDFATIDPSVLEPSPRPPGRSGGRHFVQLYESAFGMVGAVSTFLALGMATGEAGIVIAESDHRNAIDRALRAAGIDTAASRSQGSFVLLDANESLGRFMDRGMPDPAKFRDYIGSTIDAAAGSGRKVRIFGEMVALLWRRGNFDGAIMLEKLWNDLSATHQFHLFCAYPADEIGPADLTHLGEVCRQHMQVIPPAMQSRN
jgi:hypothetical protein